MNTLTYTRTPRRPLRAILARLARDNAPVILANASGEQSEHLAGAGIPSGAILAGIAPDAPGWRQAPRSALAGILPYAAAFVAFVAILASVASVWRLAPDSGAHGPPSGARQALQSNAAGEVFAGEDGATRERSPVTSPAPVTLAGMIERAAGILADALATPAGAGILERAGEHLAGAGPNTSPARASGAGVAIP